MQLCADTECRYELYEDTKFSIQDTGFPSPNKFKFLLEGYNSYCVESYFRVNLNQKNPSF